jgi:hypothetical protein
MPIEVGTQHTATWKHTANHTVTLTVTAPDGATSTPDVEEGPGGTYTAEVLLDHPGRWVLRWADTDVDDVVTDVVNVWPADPRFLISLDDAAASLRWRPADRAQNDEQLRLYVAAATEVIEDIAGAVLVRTIEQASDGGRTGVALWERPSEILSVLVDGKPTTAYIPNVNAAIVYARDGAFPPGRQNIVIRYRTGSESVSPSVQLATKELVRHLWQIGQQARSGGAADGAGAQTDPEMGQTRTGFAVPRRVIELCSNQYMLPGTA